MSNLKQLRSRIRSIKSSEKITRAMQMVAASKLQKLKHQIQDSDAYLEVLTRIMNDFAQSNLLEELPVQQQRYFTSDESKPDLFVIITSERGLCGSFNSSLIKKVKADIAKIERDDRKIKLLIVGKKGRDLLKTKYQNVIDSYYNMTKLEGPESLFLKIKERILKLIDDEKIGRCYVYYTKFRNAITQIPTKQCLLPAEIDIIENKTDKLVRDESLKDNSTYAKSNCEFEGESLINNIIEFYINGIINYALLQSRTSEEGARMTAMDNATKNAKDIIDKLTLKLNRSRQAIITKELIEIISGAEVA